MLDVLGGIALVLIFMLWTISQAEAGDQDHRCQGGHNCNDGGDVTVDIDADVDVDVSSDSEANADADAQADANADASATNDGNTVTSSTHIDARTPGRSFVGGGDSTASDQKVFAISGGWLTGSAGIRWDWTDREARTLRIADDYEADGLVAIADDLRCSLRRIYRAVGGTRTKCNGLVDSERLALSTASQGVQRDEMDELRRMVQELSESSRQATRTAASDDAGYSEYDRQDGETVVLERVTGAQDCEPCTDCTEQATRAFQACVSK